MKSRPRARLGRDVLHEEHPAGHEQRRAGARARGADRRVGRWCITSSTYAASNGPSSAASRTSPDEERVLAQAEPRGDVARDADAPRVRIDADDAAARVRLPEVRREEAEAAPDVEDAPLVGQEQIHDAEELRPEDREADERVRPLEEAAAPARSADGVAAVHLGRLDVLARREACAKGVERATRPGGRWLADAEASHCFGTPGGIRTPDMRLRRPPLYPAELRAREGFGRITRRRDDQEQSEGFDGTGPPLAFDPCPSRAGGASRACSRCSRARSSWSRATRTRSPVRERASSSGRGGRRPPVTPPARSRTR